MNLLILDSTAVQAAMLERGVGVSKLAELAKVPPKTASAAHRRDIPVFYPTAHRLAEALGIEPLRLVKAVK